jgi:hypothetical protein
MWGAAHQSVRVLGHVAYLGSSCRRSYWACAAVQSSWVALARFTAARVFAGEGMGKELRLAGAGLIKEG